jgi:hypothetical protein
MKHPARYISKRVRRVRRGRVALSREVSRTAKKLREDPSFRKLMAELAKHLAEFAIRIFVISVVNQCVRTGVPERKVTPIRPRPAAGF